MSAIATGLKVYLDNMFTDVERAMFLDSNSALQKKQQCTHFKKVLSDYLIAELNLIQKTGNSTKKRDKNAEKEYEEAAQVFHAASNLLATVTKIAYMSGALTDDALTENETGLKIRGIELPADIETIALFDYILLKGKIFCTGEEADSDDLD